MIDKRVASVAEALSGIADGATILLGGFGDVGAPMALMEGLLAQGATDLTIVCNAGGREGSAIARLLLAGRVRKMICSFIRPASDAGRLHMVGQLDVEVVPQGTLAERMRAAGAGITGFYTPTGADTGTRGRTGGARTRWPPLHAGSAAAGRRGAGGRVAG